MATFSKNTTITLTARVLNLILGLATSLSIARVLGPDGKGIYALSVLLPSLIITFTNFGIAPATVYYIGKGKYSPREIFGNNVMVSFILSAFSVIIGLVIIFFFRKPVFSGISHYYLLLTLALVPINLFFGYANAVLLGLQKIKEYNAVSIVKTSSFLGLIVIALWGLKTGIEGAILAGITANLLVDSLLFLWVKKFTHGVTLRLNSAYIKDSFLYGIKAHISNALAFLHLRLDVLLINAFINPLAVGYYSVAVGIAEKLWLISQSASTVLFPKIASEKDEKRRKEFTPLVSRATIFATAIGALVVFFLSQWIVTFLYSSVYLSAVRPLQILLLGAVAVSGGRVLGNDFAGRGRPMLNTYLNAITVAINLGLNIVWIPRFGIIGAAWATTVSYTIALIGSMIVYCRLSGNNWTVVVFPQRGDWALYWRTGLALGRWAKEKFASIVRRGG